MTQMVRTHKLASGLAALYFVLVCLSALPLIAQQDALDGIFLVFLTMPWSFGLIMVVDAINPALLDQSVVGGVITLIGALINGVLLFGVGRLLAGGRR